VSRRAYELASRDGAGSRSACEHRWHLTAASSFSRPARRSCHESNAQYLRSRRNRAFAYLESYSDIERHIARAHRLRAEVTAQMIAAAFRSPAGALRALGASVAKWQRQRRTYAVLMRCSDRTLADIGIAREDIRAGRQGGSSQARTSGAPASSGAGGPRPGFAFERSRRASIGRGGRSANGGVSMASSRPTPIASRGCRRARRPGRAWPAAGARRRRDGACAGGSTPA